MNVIDDGDDNRLAVQPCGFAFHGFREDGKAIRIGGMKIGVLFPQTEFGNDPIAIRDYAQTAEALGFDHILAADHVLGANPDRDKKLQGPYTYQNPFHEPLVLLAFMAASVERISFAIDVLILPQRQTALVAKQVATLDNLCRGRFRLGVGVGWNEVEYHSS